MIAPQYSALTVAIKNKLICYWRHRTESVPLTDAIISVATRTPDILSFSGFVFLYVL